MNTGFDSLNFYAGTEYLEARSVPELMELLKQINKPIKVHSFISHANKVYAIISGDVKIKREKKTKE